MGFVCDGDGMKVKCIKDLDNGDRLVTVKQLDEPRTIWEQFFGVKRLVDKVYYQDKYIHHLRCVDTGEFMDWKEENKLFSAIWKYEYDKGQE